MQGNKQKRDQREQASTHAHGHTGTRAHRHTGTQAHGHTCKHECLSVSKRPLSTIPARALMQRTWAGCRCGIQRTERMRGSMQGQLCVCMKEWREVERSRGRETRERDPHAHTHTHTHTLCTSSQPSGLSHVVSSVFVLMKYISPDTSSIACSQG